MKSQDEFVKGKHNIAYVSSYFTNKVKEVEFEERKGIPTFQKLPRNMSDLEIESELKPGLCTLGDMIAFMDSAPEECNDGNWNLFYTPAFVVFVNWSSGNGGWIVNAWVRVGLRWSSDDRVFSPATENLETQAS